MTKKFYAVIHCFPKQFDFVISQTDKCISNGADGIFLIMMEGGPDISKNLNNLYNYVREKFSDIFIGLNYLGLTPQEAITVIPLSANAIWIDQGVDNDGISNSIIEMNKIKKERQFNGLYFGGFSFKGTKYIPDENLDSYSKLAMDIIDIPNTSGVATGIPMSENRASLIRNSFGSEKIISVASGIDQENIETFLKYFDIFMIGTGIEFSIDKNNNDHLKKIKRKLGSGIDIDDLSNFGIKTFQGEIDPDKVIKISSFFK